MLTNKKFLEICNSDKEYTAKKTHDERLAFKVAKSYLHHYAFLFKNAAKRHDVNFTHWVTFGDIDARIKTMKMFHRVWGHDTFHLKVLNAIKTIADKNGYMTSIKESYPTDANPYLIISVNA
jgi:hypothetical protein